MRTTSTPSNAENIILTAAQNRKQIEAYLEIAAEYESKSSAQLKKGNYENAAFCAVLAQESIKQANEVKIKDIKLHAMYN